MKKNLITFFAIIIAILGGYFLGIICVNTEEPMIMWLGQSLEFGFDTFSLDLSVFQFSLGFHIAINFVQVLLILLAALAGPKIADKIK
ncbi:MAG TPA: hypothetical protein DDX71_00190 [Ruminococcus sp.]|nr:hypothetical protein [Ruminococcus sp.]